nr:unnamed protein product [Callosobruchus chinensis]
MQEQRRVRDQQEESNSMQGVPIAQVPAGWHVKERQPIRPQVQLVQDSLSAARTTTAATPTTAASRGGGGDAPAATTCWLAQAASLSQSAVRYPHHYRALGEFCLRVTSRCTVR